MKAGFVFDHQTGDHRMYMRKGSIRPVVIPTYASVGQTIIQRNMRTANMSREEYFSYLEEC